MTAITFSILVFTLTFMAALAGFQVRRFLPETCTDDATEGSIKVVLGMLTVLTTVVLGFITTDAKNSFDGASRIITDTAVRLVSIDRILANLGPDAVPIRAEIRQAAQDWVDRIASHRSRASRTPTSGW